MKKTNLIIILEEENCCLSRKVLGKLTCTLWAKCADYFTL